MKRYILQFILTVTLLLAVTLVNAQVTYESIPYNQGFEASTSFASYPEITVTGTNNHRTEIWENFHPNTGSNHVIMDATPTGTLSNNEIWIHLDLSGQSQLELSFFLNDYGDEDHTEDRIQFSDDGGTSFQTVATLTPASYTSYEYDQYIYDVDALAAGAGLSLTNTFVIKISHRDDFDYNNDGFLIDDISVYNPTINTTAVTISPLCVGGGNGSATLSSTAGDGYYAYTWPDAVYDGYDAVTRIAQSENTAAVYGTGTNRLLVVAVPIRTNSSNPTSVTFGGVEMNYFESIYVNGDREMLMQLYYLDEAGIAAGHAVNDNVVVTPHAWWTDQIYHNVMFSNVDQDNPFGTILKDSESAGSGGDATLTLPAQTIKANEYHLMVMGNPHRRVVNATGALSGYSNITDQVYDPGGSTQDLGLALYGLGYTATTTKPSSTVTFTNNLNDKALISLIINPDGSTNDALSAGVYAVTTTDNLFNTTVTNVTITDPSPIGITLTPNDYNGQDVSCNGASDGIITATIGGGATPYLYYWSNTDNTASISGLPAQAYSLTIEDDNGCFANDAITLTEPAALTAAPVVSVVPAYNGEDVSCNGANDGILSANASGGTAPYTYAWNPAAYSSSNETVGFLPTGTGFRVTVTDANGCKTVGTGTITEPSAVSISTAINATVTCDGGNDGQATGTGSGGTGAFTYLWSANTGGQTNASATGLSGGTNYYVTATDANGCAIGSSVITIDEAAAINISLVGSSDASCNGGNDGAIDINVTGGAAPYTYAWDDGPTSTTQDISSLPAATYTVTVTDNNSCSNTFAVVINEPTVLTSSLVSTVSETCFGDADGSVNISASGGTTPYSYLWSTTATTQNISSLSVGNYTATITDNQGCITTITGTVNGSGALLSAAVNGSTSVTCNGYATGTIDINTLNGTAPYTYLWDDAAATTTEDVTGLEAGTYSLTINDVYGCQVTISETITEDAGMTITSANSDHTLCATANGTINTTVTGGYSTNYTFQWSNGETTQNLTGLAGGIYYVTVNEGTCDKLSQDTVHLSGGLHAITASANPVTCNGGTDGVASVTLTAGIPASTTYVWDDPGSSTTTVVTGLAAGVYFVTANDNQCNAIQSVTVTEPNVVGVNIVANNAASCNGGNDGSLTVQGTGGNGTNYSYQWNDGASQTTASATGLMTGNYTVTVTDQSGFCSNTSTISVSEPSDITITPTITTVTCNGASSGAISIVVSGGTLGTGYSYNWVGSNVIVANKNQSSLPAGTFDLTVTDGNGCTKLGTYTVTEASPLVLTTTVTSNYNGAEISCNGRNDGKARVDVTGGNGGFSYEWDNGENTQEAVALDAGIHTVTVQDNGICDATQTVTITEPNALVGNISSVGINGSDVSCIGSTDGSATLAPTGGTAGTGYSYAWNTAPVQNTVTATGLFVGPTYRATITDVNGCKDIETIALSNPPLLTLTTAVTSNYNGEDISCIGSNDGTALATLSGGTVGTGYSYSWSNGDNTAAASGLTNTTYNVTATDGNGCSTTGSINLSAPGTLAIAASVSATINGADVSCVGASDGSISTTVTSPGTGTNYTYAWSSTGQVTANVTGISAGVSTVTVFDDNGCPATANVTLTNPSAVTATASVISSYGALGTETACSYSSDGAGTVIGSGGTVTTGYSYAWSNAENTASTTSSLAPGTHSVTVTDNNGCSGTATITITAASIIVDGASQTNVAVAGESTGSASVLPSGGQAPYTYEWTQGGPINGANFQNQGQSNLPANTYNMTITDDNGCELPVVFVITENATLDGGGITHANADGAILNVCINDTAVTNITESSAASGGNGVYSYSWEFSTDFVSWSPIVPTVTTTDYTNTFYAAETKVIRRKTTDGVGAEAYSNSMIMLSVDTTTTTSFVSSNFCGNDYTNHNLLVSPSNDTAIWIVDFPVTTITTNGDGTGLFKPADYTDGDHTITHIYTNNNGCVSTLVTTITINQEPNVTMTIPSVFQIGDTPLQLNNSVSSYVDSAGTTDFSGPYVSNNGSNDEYNPTNPGTHTIQEIYTDLNGCSDTTSANIVAQNTNVSIEVNGDNQQIGTHLCMTNDTLLIEGILGANTIPYDSDTTFIIYYDSAGFTVQLDLTGVTQQGDTLLFLTNDKIIPGGGTHTVYFYYVNTDLSSNPTDTAVVIRNFDIEDNLHIDFYVGETIESSDFEFCFEYDSVNYRAHYTFGDANLVGQGTYSSSSGNGNLGSSSNDDGRVYYNPATTVTGEIVTYNHTMIPSGCVIDTSHTVTVHDLPNLIITVTEQPTQQYCNYEVDTLIPNISGGTFVAGTYITQFDTVNAGAPINESLWLFDITNTTTVDSTNLATDPTSAPSPPYSASLCSDGYYGVPSTQSYPFRSYPFNMPYTTGSITSAQFSLYYTDCSTGDASFDIYLNGQYITTVNSLGNTCSCQPNDIIAGSYPHNFTVNGTLLDPHWNVHGSDLNNKFMIVINAGSTSTLFFAGATVNLTGNTGGTPLTKGIFDASLASVGNNAVKYQYTDGNGCYNEYNTNLTVFPQPQIGLNLDTLHNSIEGAAPIYASIGNSAILSDWYYTGNGITIDSVGVIDNPTAFGNLDSLIGEYTPSSIGAGNDTITIHFTDINGCSFEKFDATVIQDATGNFIDIDSLYCIDANLDTIRIENTNSDGNPGTYSGTGINNLGNDSATFDASANTIGNVTITYSYFGFDGTTPFSIDTVLIIENKPPVTFDMDTLFNINDPAVTLTGSPIGGTFSGTGVSGSTFDPSIAGLGEFEISYYYENNQGCFNTIIDSTVVQEAGGTFFGIPANNYYCIDGSLDSIWAVPNNGNGLPGSFTASAAGFNDLGNDTVTFEPTSLSAGDQNITITYTYSGFDNTTSFSIDTVIFVDDLPPAIISSLENGYCVDANADSLFGAPDTGGTYMFSAMLGLTSSNDTAVFTPSIAGVGVHNVTFTYTNSTSLCFVDTVVQTEVWALPALTFDMDTLFNVLETGYTMVAAPFSVDQDTSIFAINNVTITGNTFNADVLGVGEYEVDYTYTDANGCVNSIFDSTVVRQASGIFNDIDVTSYNHYCIDAPIDTIWAIGNLSHPDSIGWYTGATVDDMNNDSTRIDPTLLGGVGPTTITYHYWGDLDGITLFEIDTVINIAPLPVLTFDMDTLFNVVDNTYDLSATVGANDPGSLATDFFATNDASPGISGTNFDASVAGIGEYQINYTFIDTIGCESTVFDSTVVRAASGNFFNLPSSNHYCTDAPTDSIWANGDFSHPDSIGWYVSLIIDSSQVDSAYINANMIGTVLVPTDVTITYNYYGDLDGSTVFSIDTVVTIEPLPVLSFDMDTLFNVDSTVYDLAATVNSDDNGSLFSDLFDMNGGGAGITGTNFNPNAAGVGEYQINYTFVDTFGCQSTVFDSTVVQKSTGQWFGIPNNNYYCIDGTTDTIWAVSPNIDPNQLGTYSGGPALVQFGFPTDSVQYNPSLNDFNPNTVTNDTIVYTYFGFDGTTKFQIDTVIQVVHVGDVVITGLESEYCLQDDVDSIFGAPTYPTGSGIFTNFVGLDVSLQDTALFDPTTAGSGEHNLIYTYTHTASGCKIQDSVQTIVHEHPVLSIFAEDLSAQLNAGEYCMSVDSVRLTVNVGTDQLNSTNYPGLWTGNGVTDFIDGSAKFDPSAVGILGTDLVNDTVFFEYSDSVTTCYTKTSFEMSVFSLPIPTIAGMNAEKQYCNDAASVPLIGDNAMGISKLSATSINWIIDGNVQGVNNLLVPNSDSAGVWTIRYEYTDNRGCFNFTYDTVTISPLPVSNWTVENQCIADSTQFIDLSYIDTVYADTILDDHIVAWAWNFGVNADSKDSIQNPKYLYTNTQDRDVTLIVTTNNGCTDDYTFRLQDLGGTPPVDFSWVSECDPVTTFEIPDYVREYGDTIIWTLAFGDGNIAQGGVEDSTATNAYTVNQAYNVTMTVTSGLSGCADTASKTIYLRDIYTPTYEQPYTTNFENGTDGWLNELEVVVNTSDPLSIKYDTLVSSWEFGNPNKPTLSDAHSGVNTWITGIDSNYYQGESSKVISPCFNLDSLERPMIKVWINSETNSEDGTVLQYSIDKGVTWENLGNVGTGLNWFNTNSILGSPGDQSLAQDNIGWCSSSPLDTNWFEARHSLDVIKGQSDVRFRIAFASLSNQAVLNEGFAFDDIWIGERSRIALVEHFTNASSEKSNESNLAINEIADSNALDVVDIQYHTDFPGADPMNAFNPNDPGARDLYYSVNSVPYTIMDGNQYRGTELSMDSINLRVLEDPQFDINLVSSVSGNTLSIDAEIISRVNIGIRDISLHLAVLEKVVTADGSTYKSVLRALLPDGGGTNYEQAWYDGWVEQTTETYDLSLLDNPNNFEVVAFVQNNETQEVYQVAYVDDANRSSTVSIEDATELTTNDGFVMYPNPARDNLIIKLVGEYSENVEVAIYSGIGQLVTTYNMYQNEQIASISLDDLDNGMYLVHVKKGNNIIGIEKLIINK